MHCICIQVISDQHPKSLLILDDVWSFDVAQAFAVRCRTMVTSRNAAVASGIPTPQILSVSVSEGTIKLSIASFPFEEFTMYMYFMQHVQYLLLLYHDSVLASSPGLPVRP